MSKPVWRTAYEVLPAGMPVVEAHRADQAAYLKEGMAFAERYGATAFQPGHHGGILSLAFEDGAAVHPAFKEGGKFDDGRIKYIPNLRTKEGKAARDAMRAFRGRPTGEGLAHKLGYCPKSAPMDGYKIYWASAYDFGPTGGPVFLHIPRQAGDGFEHDPNLLAERPESALMLAMEAHNAKVEAEKASA